MSVELWPNLRTRAAKKLRSALSCFRACAPVPLNRNYIPNIGGRYKSTELNQLVDRNYQISILIDGAAFDHQYTAKLIALCIKSPKSDAKIIAKTLGKKLMESTEFAGQR
ncbi:MAG: hypothetical protein MHPSP_002829, partial [Paramarteilia canceri]